MRSTRVIPVLLIHKGGVYKTKRFKKPVYIGDPINAIRLFNDLEVDEIVILDVDASKHNNPPNFEFIEELASEAFMPFSYGGGIKTVDQAKNIFQLGIEKIVLNHAVQNNYKLIIECADKFGSQSIVVSINYKKKLFNGEMCYDHVSNNTLKINVIDAVIAAEKAGAGEIIINSVDRDGLMAGLDVDLIKELSAIVNNYVKINSRWYNIGDDIEGYIIKKTFSNYILLQQDKELIKLYVNKNNSKIKINRH